MNKEILNAGAFVPGKHVEYPATSSGILDGLSCGVKDVFDIAGCTTGYGNPEWEKTHPVPASDASAVARLRAQGARIVGKTVTDELAFSLAGNNYHYGSPLNTAAPDRLTGGSSCGSAAAVAAGLCDIGLGTDTAGSVRAPASFCGLFGIRTSHGAIAKDGVCGLAPSFDAIGWMTRDARTLATVGDVLLPDAPVPASPQEWVSLESAWASLRDVTQHEANELLRELEPSLGKRSQLYFDLEELDKRMAAFRTLQFYEVWQELGPWVTQVQPVLGPDIRERFTAASRVTQDEYLAANKVRTEARNRLGALLEGGRVLVMPTVSAPGPKRSASVEELNAQRLADLRFLCVAGLAGLPQISVPALSVSGAPLGMSFIGAPGTDKALLALVARLEAQGALR